MDTNNNAPRITLTPSIPLRSYPVTGAPVWRDGDWLCTPEGFDIDADRRELPEELVLREQPRWNLADPDAIAEIVHTFGVLGDFPTPLLAALRRTTEPADRPASAIVSVVDARNQLHAVRAMTNHWVASMHGESIVAAWQAEGFGVQDDLGAVSVLTSLLNAGLTSYHPRIEFELPPTRVSVLPEGAHVTGVPKPGLYGGLCLQVFNLIAENLAPHTCGNENCQRLFVRQQSDEAPRSQRHTSGVDYCSRRCAKATAQRKYRRRTRQSDGPGEGEA